VNDHADVVRVLSPAEALAFIVDRGVVDMRPSELARAFGWSRQRAHQWIERQVRDGLLIRDGSVIRVVNNSETAVTPVNADDLTPVTSPDKCLVAESLEGDLTAIDAVDMGPFTASAPSKHVKEFDSLRAAVIASALALAAVGMTINARFAASLGQSPDASVMLAALGWVADVLALILPAAGARLFLTRQWWACTAAWCIWCAALGVTLLATAGWSATNISDSLKARALAAGRTDSALARLQVTAEDRKTVVERRSVTELDAALVGAQAAAGRAWDRTNGCRDVDHGDLVPCRRVIDLRVARGRAEQRDRLDIELADLQRGLGGAPTISAADPGATIVAATLPWITHGILQPTESDVQRLRVLLLTVLPAVAGLLLGVGVAMRRG
jgi:hypothetical protein